MAGEIHKILFLFCILSSSFLIQNAASEILNGEELGNGINKTKLVIINEASGHSALMQCNLQYHNMIDVIWYKNGTSLTNSSHHLISQSYQVIDFTKTINSRSILKISPLTTDDSGSYDCKFNNTDLQLGHTVFTLIVSPSNTPDLLFSSFTILGIIFVFVLVIYVIKYAFNRRR